MIYNIPIQDIDHTAMEAAYQAAYQAFKDAINEDGMTPEEATRLADAVKAEAYQKLTGKPKPPSPFS
tara:strand:+ start:193 stop:393 length:201 start_codon:yes stop_codon:yes gene_type:complete